MPRMNILNTVEREAFESPPVFNSVQRKQYFDFPTELRRLAGELRAPTRQLGFLLSAGYFGFRAKAGGYGCARGVSVWSAGS